MGGMPDEVGARGEGSKEQNIPPGELIPEEERFYIAGGLGRELVDTLVTIPDFREKAARAFAHGLDSVVFSHEGRDYELSSWRELNLRIGEPGAFEFASTKGTDVELSITHAGLLTATDIRYLDKDVYQSSLDRPDWHFPQRNTRAAERSIRRVIQSLKLSQPATSSVSPTG